MTTVLRYDASVIVDVSLGTDKIIQLDVGHAHSCVLTNKGEVRCWGDGKNGATGRDNELALGDTEHPSAEDPVDVGWTVAQVSLQGSITVALCLLTAEAAAGAVMTLGSLVRAIPLILEMAQVQR